MGGEHGLPVRPRTHRKVDARRPGGHLGGAGGLGPVHTSWGEAEGACVLLEECLPCSIWASWPFTSRGAIGALTTTTGLSLRQGQPERASVL